MGRDLQLTRPGLRRSIFWPVAVALFALLCVLLSILAESRRRWIDFGIEAAVASVAERSVEREAAEVEILSLALDEVVSPGVAELLMAGDRDRLEQRYAGVFERLRSEHAISHLYFLDRDRRVLLRSHAPARHGDRIERVSAIRAESRRRSAHAVELGPLGTLTLRVVRPVFSSGEIVGYVEAGRDLSLAKGLGPGESGPGEAGPGEAGRVREIFIRKDALEAKQWIQGRQLLGLPAEWAAYQDFVKMSSGALDLPPERIEKALARPGEPIASGVEGQRTRVLTLPLSDASGREVGVSLIEIDTGPVDSAVGRAVVYVALGVTAIGAFLLFAFWRLVDRVDGELRKVEAREGELRIELEGELSQRTQALERESQERERAQVQLRHAQKMEALGQLTGGVAHDFNNLLTVIGGNVALFRHSNRQPELEDMELLVEAGEAVDRASKLTDQLLAFSRKQVLQPRVVDLCTSVGGMLSLLRRTLGERIRVEFEPTTLPATCKVDPAQLEHALLNLVINARDAMEGGGVLRLVVRRLTKPHPRPMGEPLPLDQEAPLGGRFVELAVIDDGVGMDERTVERVFDPFFTTKPAGVGTGLGLSMVHGFVFQSGGDIAVESQEGAGTTVRLWLPAAEPELSESVGEAPVVKVARKTGLRVLVVEDEGRVRKVAVKMLGHLGYETVEVTRGDDAWERLSGGLAVDIIFSDVVLPGELDGPGLIRRVILEYPNIACVMATGYVSAARLEGLEQISVLSKPYRVEELAAALEQAREHIAAAQAERGQPLRH